MMNTIFETFCVLAGVGQLMPNPKALQKSVGIILVVEMNRVTS